MNNGDYDFDSSLKYTEDFLSQFQSLLGNIIALRSDISNLIDLKDLTVTFPLPPNMLVSVVQTVSALQRSFCRMEGGLDRLVASFKLACPKIFHETKAVDKIIANSNMTKRMLESALSKIGGIDKKEIVLKNQSRWNAWQQIFVSTALRNFNRNRWNLYILEMKSQLESMSLQDYLSSLKSRSFCPTRIVDLTPDPSRSEPIGLPQFVPETNDWDIVTTAETQTNLSGDPDGTFRDRAGLTYKLRECTTSSSVSIWTEEWKYKNCLLLHLDLPQWDYDVHISVDDVPFHLGERISGPRDLLFPEISQGAVRQIKLFFKKRGQLVLLGVVPSSLMATLHVVDVVGSLREEVRAGDLGEVVGKYWGLEALGDHSVLIRLHSIGDLLPDVEFVGFGLGQLWYCRDEGVDVSTGMGVPQRTRITSIETNTESVETREAAVLTEKDEGESEISREKEAIKANYEGQIKELEARLSLKASEKFKIELSKDGGKTSSADNKKMRPATAPKTRAQSAFHNREAYRVCKPTVNPFRQKKWCLAAQVIPDQRITKYSAMVHPRFYPMSHWNKTRENSPPSMLSLPPVRKARGIGIVNLYNTCIQIKQTR